MSMSMFTDGTDDNGVRVIYFDSTLNGTKNHGSIGQAVR